MKKYLQLFFVALFAATSFTFTACSDDDDDNTSPLAGTSWKVMTSEEDDGIIGKTITFNADGTVGNLGWTYARWSLDGDVLKIVVGEDMADDFMIGKIEISGEHATYKYHWEDAEGGWVGDKTYTITLRKV